MPEIIDIECMTPDSKWLKLWEVKYRLDGDTEERAWTFVSRRDKPEAIESREKADAVVIIPFVDDKIVVIKEFRAPLGGYEYGFPAGLLEEGESPATVAHRELEEETGLKVSSVKMVSPPLFSSAGLSDESTSLVWVQAEGEISDRNLEEGEDIKTMLLTRAELKKLLERKGEYKNAKFGCKFWPIAFSWLSEPIAFSWVPECK